MLLSKITDGRRGQVVGVRVAVAAVVLLMGGPVMVAGVQDAMADSRVDVGGVDVEGTDVSSITNGGVAGVNLSQTPENESVTVTVPVENTSDEPVMVEPDVTTGDTVEVVDTSGETVVDSGGETVLEAEVVVTDDTTQSVTEDGTTADVVVEADATTTDPVLETDTVVEPVEETVEPITGLM